VLFIFTVVFFSKSRLRNVQNQIYGVLLIQSMLTILLDIGSVFAIVNRDVAGNLTAFFAKGYLCTMIVWATMISVYAISLTGIGRIYREKPGLFHVLLGVLSVIVLGLCTFIVIEDIFYYSDGRNVYSYGLSTTVLYIYAAISVCFCFVLVIIKRKEIPFIKRLSVYVYFGIIVTASMIQIFHPKVLVVSAGGALSMIFMYFTLENPDMELIEELNEARKEADRANQAKANFLANMSHEIRTPINAVIGMNEMILRENKNEEITNYALQIEKAGYDLLSVINDILDFSKIESGKMDIIPTKYLVCSMIQEIYSMCKISTDKKNLEFIVKADIEFPRILYGDEIRLKQIVMNLVSNAIKYTQQGRVTLLFEYEMCNERELDFIVKVMDTGQGIKKESQDNLFESFQRIEQEKNRYIEGTGLGLAITKQLLEAMNGSIEIESEYGKGSTFTVHILQEIVDDTPMGEFEPSELPLLQKQKWVQGVLAPNAKVLIVDDSEVNLAVAAALLKRSRAKVTLAVSGEECIRCMQKDNFHLVFIDYMMPEMDGVHTIEIIREEELQGEAKLIVLTGTDMNDTYQQIGFDGYIRKPIEPKQLDMILKTYLPKDCLQEEI